MTRIQNSSPATANPLHWLLRYARHSQVTSDPGALDAHAIKRCFTPPAWRLLCRSSRGSFMPILRNRHLAFDSLVHYARRLAESGFQVAPNPVFLEYFIQSSYYFFDRMPGVPDQPDEMALLRLATRSSAGGSSVVSRAQLRRVDEWVNWAPGSVSTCMAWRAVLRRADQWHQRQQLAVEQARNSATNAGAPRDWEFACGPVAWEGYEIVPLVNSIDLWDEGQAMSSCLYKLRGLCQAASTPSRFFSVRRNGRRHATLELVENMPDAGLDTPAGTAGLEKLSEGWRLQDCRLSHNRLPPEALLELLTGFARHYSDHLSQSCAGPLGYRLHTRLTAAWWAEHHAVCQEFIDRYATLAAPLESAPNALTSCRAGAGVPEQSLLVVGSILAARAVQAAQDAQGLHQHIKNALKPLEGVLSLGGVSEAKP